MKQVFMIIYHKFLKMPSFIEGIIENLVFKHIIKENIMTIIKDKKTGKQFKMIIEEGYNPDFFVIDSKGGRHKLTIHIDNSYILIQLAKNYNQKFEQDWIYFTVSEMSLQ